MLPPNSLGWPARLVSGRFLNRDASNGELRGFFPFLRSDLVVLFPRGVLRLSHRPWLGGPDHAER